MKKLAVFTSKMAGLIAQKFGALCQKNCDVKISSTSEHFAGQFLGQESTGQTQEAGNYYLPFSAGKDTPCGFVSIPPQTAIVWTTQLLGDTETKEKSISSSVRFSIRGHFSSKRTNRNSAKLSSVGADWPKRRLRIRIISELTFQKVWIPNRRSYF